MKQKALERLIGEVLAKRPDLWEVFRINPEAALEEAGIELSDEDRAVLHAFTDEEAKALFQRAKDDAARKLGASLQAELEHARAEEQARLQHLAETFQQAEETSDETAADGLAPERQQLQSQEEKLRAALAEERKRLEEARRRAARLLGS